MNDDSSDSSEKEKVATAVPVSTEERLLSAQIGGGFRINKLNIPTSATRNTTEREGKKSNSTSNKISLPLEEQIIIRRAVVHDINSLNHILLNSKNHWGYEHNTLQGSDKALALTEDFLNNHSVFLAETKETQKIVGFSALLEHSSDSEKNLLTLSHLYAVPDKMATLVLQTLYNHAEGLAKNTSKKKLRIESEPNNISFFIKLGAQHIGEQESYLNRERLCCVLEKNL